MKVYVPEIDRTVTVTKRVDGKPVQGKYIDDNGDIQVVNLITTSWQLVSVVKKLWSILKSIFKF